MRFLPIMAGFPCRGGEMPELFPMFPDDGGDGWDEKDAEGAANPALPAPAGRRSKPHSAAYRDEGASRKRGRFRGAVPFPPGKYRKPQPSRPTKSPAGLGFRQGFFNCYDAVPDRLSPAAFPPEAAPAPFPNRPKSTRLRASWRACRGPGAGERPPPGFGPGSGGRTVFSPHQWRFLHWACAISVNFRIFVQD